MTQTRLKPTNGVLDGKRHHLPLRVYYEDTDSGGLMYYARYLYFTERARSEFLRMLCASLGHADMHDFFSQQGIMFVVKEVSASYHASVRLNDVVIVATDIIHVGAASLTLEQNMLRDGRCLFESRVRLACLRQAGDHRPCGLSPSLKRLLTDFVRV